MCKSPSALNDTLDGVISFDLQTDNLHRSSDEQDSYTLSMWSPEETPNKRKNEKDVKKIEIHVSRYLRLIIEPDKDGDNLLFLAIILGETKLAMLLIDLIPDYKWLWKQNRQFQTALHLAALTNNCTIVRRLVVAGIEVHKQDWRGNTALHIASLHGLLDIAEALLKPVTYSETKLNSYEIPYQPLPQNLEIRNADGLTCFLIATINRDKDLMDILISKNADINSFDMKSGKTCLHILAEYGDSVLIKHVLSKQGVKVNAKTYAGYTAVHFARARAHDQVAYLLRCAGANEISSDDELISD